MAELLVGLFKLILIAVIGVLLISFIYMILLVVWYRLIDVWLWLDDHYFTITLGNIKGKWLNISLFSEYKRLINDLENAGERLRRFNKELIEKYGGEIDRKYEQESEPGTHL